MATITTRLTPLDHGRVMTLEDFRAAEAEEGYRYELARGVVEATKIPGIRHNQVVSNLYCAMSTYRGAYPGFILRFGGGNESRVYVPELISGRNPDLAVVLRHGPGSKQRNPLPSLVAEVVSKRSVHRDYVLKREEYLAFGLGEYWIVDFWLRRLTLLVRDRDAWVEQILTDDQVIPSVVLPGLTTTVNDLWLNLDY